MRLGIRNGPQNSFHTSSNYSFSLKLIFLIFVVFSFSNQGQTCCQFEGEKFRLYTFLNNEFQDGVRWDEQQLWNSISVIFFRFFKNVAQVAIMHKQYLAKFGNIQSMKVENLMHPLHIVGDCGDFKIKINFLPDDLFSRKQRICDRIFFFLMNIFHKMTKIHY